MRIVAFVSDLMDRSRLTGALPGVEFTARAETAVGADGVVVDLVRFGTALGEIRAAAPAARVVAFGPHVDDELLARATADGADLVLPRSRFFRDPAAALTGT